MKVLLDATAIPANLGGVGRYVDDLVPCLVSQGVNLALAVQSRDAEHFASRAPRAHIITVPHLLERRPVRMAWEQYVSGAQMYCTALTTLTPRAWRYPMWAWP